MSFLPEIEEGEIKIEQAQLLYTPPQKVYTRALKEEERQHELNNLRRKPVSQDFSDSPHLDI